MNNYQKGLTQYLLKILSTIFMIVVFAVLFYYASIFNTQYKFVNDVLLFLIAGIIILFSLDFITTRLDKVIDKTIPIDNISNVDVLKLSLTELYLSVVFFIICLGLATWLFRLSYIFSGLMLILFVGISYKKYRRLTKVEVENGNTQ